MICNVFSLKFLEQITLTLKMITFGSYMAKDMINYEHRQN